MIKARTPVRILAALAAIAFSADTEVRASAPDAAALATTPLVRQWRAGTGAFELAPGTSIVAAGGGPALQEAQKFAADLAMQSGLRLSVLSQQAAKRLPRDRSRIEAAIVTGDRALGPEAYRIAITDRSVRLEASTAVGLFYGFQTLLQLLKTSPDGRTLATGTIDDAPVQAIRSVMLDAGRRYYAMDSLARFMRLMAWHKMNTLHLHLTDWPAFRLNSPKYPGLAPAQGSYSRADIRRLEAAARRYHITIIPEIDLPAHAVAVTKYKPDLAFTCPSMRYSPWLEMIKVPQEGTAWTIDIGKEANRKWLRGLLDEFIPWFDGPYFHIGGDEYQYDDAKTQCPELMAATKTRGFRYPGDLFVDWMNDANRVVKRHGKTAVMWNWWGYRNDRTSISPDKDIVINLWNGPETQRIMGQGYRVILSPESDLYVSPGLNDPDGYGVVDLDEVYERWRPIRSPQVLGYALSMWSDRAERNSDGWFFGHAYQPMIVLSERLWTGTGSGDVDELLARANRVGFNPPDTAPPR